MLKNENLGLQLKEMLSCQMKTALTFFGVTSAVDTGSLLDAKHLSLGHVCLHMSYNLLMNNVGLYNNHLPNLKKHMLLRKLC